MREQMIARFRSHLGDVDKGYFFKQREGRQANATIMMSKKDIWCGGQGCPMYSITFMIKDVRPVDVFNVLAHSTAQPEWLCNGCTVRLIENDVEEQVQGFAAAYRSPPLNRREFYQWQAYDADFVNEEFIVGVQAKGNEVLHKKMDKEPDATVARMCMAFSWIRKHPLGTFIVQMSHFNVRVGMAIGPFTPRNMYHVVWPMILKRVPRIAAQSKVQNAKGWEADRLSIPGVFIGQNMTSKTAQTNLIRIARKGDRELFVVSNDGFTIGSKVIIDPGSAYEEENRVANRGSLILQDPLNYTHAAGTIVTMPGVDFRGVALQATDNNTHFGNIDSWSSQSPLLFAGIGVGCCSCCLIALCVCFGESIKNLGDACMNSCSEESEDDEEDEEILYGKE
jgi:hypothetical protein